MIFDDISNLKDYGFVSEDILKFIEGLSISTPVGRYEISDTAYANIEEYDTKSSLEACLESHRKYIDIQFLLSGEERIDFLNIDGLKHQAKYNPVKDIIFYKRPKVELNRLYLNGRNFAIFFPQDAHAPQITTMGLQNNVKKVVIKIMVKFDDTLCNI